MEARSAITVNGSPAAVYERWRKLEDLPTFMAHLQSVRAGAGALSHWVARGPAGTTVEWDAEITDDVPGTRLAWRSIEGADVDNEGEVRFAPAPGDQGTEVQVRLRYEIPGGAVGSALATALGEEPEQQVSDDLRRFKQLFETGEIARSDGNPYGVSMRHLANQRGAQPLTPDEIVDLTQQEVHA